MQQVKIGDSYVQKALCRRCPHCGNWVIGLSVDGIESCIKNCGYERKVFTDEECEYVGFLNAGGDVIIYQKKRDV